MVRREGAVEGCGGNGSAVRAVGRGPEAIMQFWKGLDETFDELQLLPQEFVDAGDLVATRLRHYGRGKRSGLEMDEEMYHQVVTFRDGKMVRIEYFTDWDQALEATTGSN